MLRIPANSRLTRFCAFLCITAVLSGALSSVSGAEPADSASELNQSSDVSSPTSKTDESSPAIADRGRRTSKSDKTSDIEVQMISRGTSSSAVRANAVKALPLNNLNDQQRKIVDDVIRLQSLYRRLPTVSFETNLDAYKYFIVHPDVAVSIWRVMKISKVEMWQTGRDEFESDAGDGSLGFIEVLHRGNDKTLIYCEGIFKTPLLRKPIRGRALLHLQTSYSRDAEKRTHVTHHVDLFVAFPSATINTAVKIISPLCNMLADRNFREISTFLRMMSLAMENQPGWVEHIADRLEGVLPIRKTQLLKLTAQVYIEARERALAASGMKAEDVTSDDIIGPLKKLGARQKAEQQSDPVKRISLDDEFRNRAKPKFSDAAKVPRIATEDKTSATDTTAE